jgi:dTDP-4-dehydrorhamnose reductase
MKVLVTGSGGLLGQKLVDLLIRQPDVQVIVTARRKMVAPPDADFQVMDITQSSDIARVFSLTSPDTVINTAAMTQVDDCEVKREECWNQNVTAVDHLVKACEEYHAHLIHVSTDFIFDGSHGPLTEDEKPGPVNYYGESKLAGEKIVGMASCPWTILRTVLVYGVTPDMSRSNIVLWVKKSLEEGKPIRVVNDQWRTPTLAEDLAMGCWLATKNKKTGVFNISGRDMMTPFDIAMRTAEFFKLDKSLITPTDSTHFKQPAARPMKTGFVIEKAKRDLGYEPRSFEEGLRVVADQLRKVDS